jgi:hypothetical protein
VALPVPLPSFSVGWTIPDAAALRQSATGRTHHS